MYSLRNPRPLGMQVHAVPESERFVDETGRRLPWGYEYTPNTVNEAEQQNEQEKGPFGRNSRRSRTGLSRSRSKTAEPRREEDRQRAENVAAEDAVFGSLRRVTAKDDGRRDAAADSDALNAGARLHQEAEVEPTEVLLYGFGEDLQWAAIDFYERVSNGLVLEDYDRQPPGQRYDASLSLGRAAAQNTLSRAAMRKRNKYAGGNHWIKITFDSRQAAELAIASGPHIIKGYLVYAEPYQNRGPQRDEPVLATQAGAQVTSDVLPATFSTENMDISPDGSPSTLSSTTATAMSGPIGSRSSRTRLGLNDSPTNSDSTIRGNLISQPARPLAQPLFAPRSNTTAFQRSSQVQPQARRARIEGTTPATVLPADMALAPKQPQPSWSSWIGASEIIGSALPRKEDGSFDWNRASLYWRIFFYIDMLFGTDFCGLRTEE